MLSCHKRVFLHAKPINRGEHRPGGVQQRVRNVLIVSPNYNFSPPITMYQALKIALESDSWNATSLENMTVTVSLDYMEFLNSSTGSCSELIHEVTNPAPYYSDMQVNSTTTYRYIWSVEVNRAQGFTYPPFGYYLVDAQTGELVPHEPLY